ncbi:MAG: hypothetical protein HGB06_10235 [Chlorobaculum sp.]|jgi:hypothetical protein|nr:hypothetical protein [Chlorobaculum sp.]
MGETVKLNDAIRMIWRDAARFIAQAMREEVSESGNKNVEEWALEVETLADGLIPLFDGRALRDGWSWTDEKVLSTLKASGRLQTAILQGMGALNPAVRAEFVARGDGSKWTRAFIEEQQWRKAEGLAISQEYVIYEAFRLFMSTVAETKQPEASATTGDCVPDEQFDEPAATGKIPGGFVGFCLEKIETMQIEERGRFLSVNRGDSSFFDYRNTWNKEWVDKGNTPYKKPQEGISKAKNIYRKLHKKLKN